MKLSRCSAATIFENLPWNLRSRGSVPDPKLLFEKLLFYGILRITIDHVYTELERDRWFHDRPSPLMMIMSFELKSSLLAAGSKMLEEDWKLCKELVDDGRSQSSELPKTTW